MGYCFMTMTKIHTMTELMKRADHNLREKEIFNADPDRAHLNDEMVMVKDHDIVTAWENKFNSLEHYKENKLRKDAPRAIEIVMSLPKEDAAKVDLEKWKQANMKWLEKEFETNKELHGSNLLSVVYHGDETNAHIHAIVTPVTKDGRIRTTDWMSRKKLISLQDSYAKEMKQFGLERGLRGTKAKHKDIARMYAKIDQNLQSVEQSLAIQPNESIEEYHDRVVDYMQTRTVAMQRQIDDKDRTILEARHESREWKKKFESLGIDAEIKDAKNTVKDQHERKEQQGIEREYGDSATIRKQLEKLANLEAALDKYPDREMANITKDNIQELIRWQETMGMSKENQKKKEREKKTEALEEKLFGR